MRVKLFPLNFLDIDVYKRQVNGNIIDGLGIFPYYTEAIEDRTKRCIGNIVLDVNINNQNTKVIGCLLYTSFNF